MKTFRFLDIFLCSALALSILTLQTSCGKDDDPIDTTYTLAGSASGSQEVPANATTGTGTLSGTYNSANNTLTYTINWTGLTGVLTAAHFHGPALAGAVAGPIHDLSITANGTSGSAAATLLIADSTEVHLLSGKIYYNLHTGTYPGGEIRGQVVATN